MKRKSTPAKSRSKPNCVGDEGRKEFTMRGCWPIRWITTREALKIWPPLKDVQDIKEKRRQ